MGKFLIGYLKNLVKKTKVFIFKRYQLKRISEVIYWENRVKKLGKRSVFDTRHSDDEIAALTEKQKKEIFPIFLKLLKGNEKTILDFGCGWGRFTPDLARLIHGRAIGVDPIIQYFNHTKERKNTIYLPIKNEKIPLPDSSINVVWIHQCLGGITDRNALLKTIKELDRVLQPGGLLFCVEDVCVAAKRKNTTTIPKKWEDSLFDTGEVPWERRSFNQYKQILQFVRLKKLIKFCELDKTILIMAGRKND